MLKIAYQLGVKAAFDEVDIEALTKEAAKAGLLGRAWKGLKGMSRGKQTALGVGTGLAGLGTAAALYPREEEQSALSRVGDTARGLLGNRELMMGLTQSLGGGFGGGGGGMGLTPGDMESFPPDPQAAYAQQQMSPQYGEYM